MSIGMFGAPPSSSLAAENVIVADPRAFYQVIRYSTGSPGTKFPFTSLKEIQTGGNHIYVSELNGPAPIYIRLGLPTNPWIRLSRGMKIQREFPRFWLRTFDSGETVQNAGNSPGIADCVLYVSVDPIIVEGGKNDGLRSGFATVGPVTFGPAPLTSDVLSLISSSGGTRNTFGKNGGFVMITNEGAGDFRISSQSLDTTKGFLLRAGSTISLPVSERLRGGTALAGLFIHNQGRIAKYSALFSCSEFDLTDLYQTTSLSLY